MEENATKEIIHKQESKISIGIPDHLAKLKEKNIFFVLSSGRSGTQTIAKSISELPDCVCLHEPAPELILESAAYRYGRLDKERLKNLLLQTRTPIMNGKVYGESNQTLSLMLPVIAEAFPKGKFIWLIRNGLDVVSSTFARQWYTGHSANHARYKDCPQIEKDWIDGRIMGDLCGDVPVAKWKSMNPFARCCWYWAFVNRTIEQDLRQYGSTDSYLQIKLEHLDRDLPEIIEWLGFDYVPAIKPGRHNKAHYQLHPWQKWTSEEKCDFLYWCGPLMDRLYPDWRVLNRDFLNDLNDDSNSVKQYTEIHPQVIKDSVNNDHLAAKEELPNIYFTPQIKTHPKISVYIPSYNQKNYLVEAIESVLAQNLKPHQIIIVDDCSNDGSQELIAKYAQKYPNLIYPIFHTNNSGVVQTRIDALNAVTGDYVTYVDGDDRFLPEKLELEFNTLSENTEAQIAYSNNYYINPEGQRVGVWAENETPAEGSIFKETFSRSFPKNNLFRMELINYQAWKSVGFHDPDITIYEDYDMRIRLTKHFKVAFCDVPLSEIRQHNKGLSKLKAKQHLASLEFIYHKNKVLLTDLNNSEQKDVKRGFNNFVNYISHKAASQLTDDSTLKKQDANHIYKKTVGTESVTSKFKNHNDLGNNLIFLISQPRAGSTLFQRLLAGHPEIHSTAEPWVMLHPLYALKNSGINTEYRSDLALSGLNDFVSQVPEGMELYRNALRKFGLTLYNRTLELSGKQYFLDKTPRYYHIIPELYSIFPEAKFIFLLRNPIAVLSSILKTWYQNQFDSLRIQTLIDLVRGPVCLLNGIKKLKENAIVVEYESLVHSPESMLHRVCSRIGIPYFKDMINYGKSTKPKGRFGDSVGIYQHNRPVTCSIDKWLNNLSSPELIEFAEQYLHTLGKNIVSSMGYNYDELKKKLELQGQVFQKQLTKSETITRLNQEGERLFINKEYDVALSKFRTAYELDPNYAKTQSNLGLLYYQIKDMNNALKHYQKAIQLDPQNITYLKNIANFSYVELGNIQEAFRICVEILKLKPEDIETLLLLAKISIDLKKYEDAKVFYDLVLKIDPKNVEANHHYSKLKQISDVNPTHQFCGLYN